MYVLELLSMNAQFTVKGAQKPEPTRTEINADTDEAALLAATAATTDDTTSVGYLLAMEGGGERIVAVRYVLRLKDIELGISTYCVGQEGFWTATEKEALERFGAADTPYRKVLYGPKGMIANHPQD